MDGRRTDGETGSSTTAGAAAPPGASTAGEPTTDSTAASVEDPTTEVSTTAPTDADRTAVVPTHDATAPDSDATVTVTRGSGAPDPDATVSVPAGTWARSAEPTTVGPSAYAPPPNPYGPAAWPAGTWAPGQPPYGGGPGGTAQWPGHAPEPIRRRNGRPLATLAIVLVLAVVALLVFVVLPPGATSAVGAAADQARTWSGVTYRGQVRGPGGQPVTVDMTVGPNGDKSGTLTRSGGGRAEFAESGGVQALRANAAWWTGLPQGTDKGRRLAGAWLRNPAPETTWLAPLPLLSPSALADTLAPAGGTEYTDAGDQQVDGVEGRVVTAPDRRLVLADDRDARLLSVVPPEAADPAGLSVVAADPAGLSGVDRVRASVASAEDYAAILYDPSDVTGSFLPAPDCTTPTCTITLRLTNPSGLEARGFVTITIDGRVLNRSPLKIGPGGTATFTASSPNAAYAAGRDVQVYYSWRVSAS